MSRDQGRAGHRRRPEPSTSGQALGFVLRFGLFWALALGIVSQVPAIERWAVESTTANLVLLMRALRVETSALDNLIQTGDARIEIVPDCTPLMPTMVFWSAVIAFPAPWGRRLLGVAIGAAAVWAFNLLRVTTLIAVLWWMPQHFKFVHVYLWQAGTMLVVIAMFMYWVRAWPPRVVSA